MERIFSHKMISSQCLMHKIISMTIFHENQVQFPHTNVNPCSTAYLSDPSPLKCPQISWKIGFLMYFGLNVNDLFKIQ